MSDQDTFSGPGGAGAQLDQYPEITIVQKDTDLSMESCGYP